MTVIRGHRVLLRPVEGSDHPRILRWQNDPEVWWWMDYERTLTLEDIVESETRATQEGHPFIIAEAGGRAIGRIGLNQFRERDRICSLYVFIGEHDEWGHSFGRDAILAILGWGFETFDLHMVELWGLSENERAIRTYRACGFVVDGTLRERSFKTDGAFHDRTVMSVSREEYAAARERFDRGAASSASA